MRTFRTVLEQKIWERRQTFEEFAEFAEVFAREHNEPGTLGVRHLQRLAAGRRSDGQPLGLPRPATARLLEHIFSTSIDELLSPANTPPVDGDSSGELRRMLHAAGRIDHEVVTLLHEQLTAVRRLDRQLGAVIAHDEVTTKTAQVSRLLAYSLSPGTREKLAALLSELSTLAGWQALDLGEAAESWRHYEDAKNAARQSGAAAFEAHAAAEQAFVLVDVGESESAADLLAETRRAAEDTCSRLLRAWLAAAHGEALAANAQRTASLCAFDVAATLLPDDSAETDGPYVVLDPIHLARWRGHALARFADPEAVDVLSSALARLDPTFTRAETGLRVDLATALAAIGERDEARAQAEHAGRLAALIGSARQQRRMRALAGQLG